MILIHGAPGVRLGFLNAFLSDKLRPSSYDVGSQGANFYKLHSYNEEAVQNFTGKKFYIKLSNELLFRHLFLFFEKNILVQVTQYSQWHYTNRNVVDKLYYSAKTFFDDQQATDVSLYDYVVPFESTYDIDYLISLYQDVNNSLPSDELLESVVSTNRVNTPDIPDNHGARVAATIFNFEYKNNYLEENRQWVLNDVAPFDHESGESLDKDNLYSNISKYLTAENYKCC